MVGWLAGRAKEPDTNPEEVENLYEEVVDAANDGAALARVESRYTWTRYAERLLTLSRVYGFWKYVTRLERDEAQRYLEMLYALQFRPLAEAMA